MRVGHDVVAAPAVQKILAAAACPRVDQSVVAEESGQPAQHIAEAGTSGHADEVLVQAAFDLAADRAERIGCSLGVLATKDASLGTIAWQGEISYRPNMPLQVDDGGPRASSLTSALAAPALARRPSEAELVEAERAVEGEPSAGPQAVWQRHRRQVGFHFQRLRFRAPLLRHAPNIHERVEAIRLAAERRKSETPLRIGGDCGPNLQGQTVRPAIGPKSHRRARRGRSVGP